MVIWPDSVFRVTPVALFVAWVTVPPERVPMAKPAVASNCDGISFYL
jgi:hypothetical protein